MPALLGLAALVVAVLAPWRVATSRSPPFRAMAGVTFSVVPVVGATGFAATDCTARDSFGAVEFFPLTAVGGCTGGEPRAG